MPGPKDSNLYIFYKINKDMSNLTLSEIYIYPVKSLGGILLKEAKAEHMGLQYDRRWMLIDENGIFITQRKYTELALLKVSIEKAGLKISHKLNPQLNIWFSFIENTGNLIPVTIWDDQSIGLEVSKEVNEWFSAFMKKDVRLVYMQNGEKRFVDPKYAKKEEIVGFADGYPFLIISQASLDGLNEQLEKPVPMNRFRPNFVFTGGDPHIEDRFENFTIGEVTFTAVKPCARCVLTTVDQETSEKSSEPLKTLSRYRTINKKVMFGQNLLHQANGMVKIGDSIVVNSWKHPISAQ